MYHVVTCLQPQSPCQYSRNRVAAPCNGVALGGPEKSEHAGHRLHQVTRLLDFRFGFTDADSIDLLHPEKKRDLRQQLPDVRPGMQSSDLVELPAETRMPDLAPDHIIAERRSGPEILRHGLEPLIAPRQVGGQMLAVNRPTFRDLGDAGAEHGLAPMD